MPRIAIVTPRWPARQLLALGLVLFLGSLASPVACGQHSLRGAGPGWGGFSLGLPGGHFTMYQGPVGGWPGFYPQPWGWGVTPGPFVYPAPFPGWGSQVIFSGPAVSWPVGPLYVDPRDLGFGPHPPELPPLPPPDQVERLRQLPGADAAFPPANPAGPGNVPPAAGQVAPPPGLAQPPQDNPPLFLKASNLEQRRRSLRAQTQGDEQFRRLQFLPAVGRYRQAAEAAPDLPEPRLRLALALVALGEFSQGVEHLKRGLRLDPDYAAHGPGLVQLLGPGQHLAADTILQRVAGWVREDIRDPDRLLLLGVLLHFREDADQARDVLRTAAQLAGEASLARQFLNSLNRPAQMPRADDAPNIPPPPAPGIDAGPQPELPVNPPPVSPSPVVPPRAVQPAAATRTQPVAPQAPAARRPAATPPAPLRDPAPVPHPPEEEPTSAPPSGPTNGAISGSRPAGLPAAGSAPSRSPPAGAVVPAPGRAPGGLRPRLSPPA